MVDPPPFSDSKHRDLGPRHIARDFDPPLPEDTAQRAANRAIAEAAKAKKEQKKVTEGAKLQRGRRRQGSEESDDDEEEDESDSNIPWGVLTLVDE